MLNMDLNMPVTLVVKAPNQKFEDLTVECALDWTIRKLKEHLANVYPNQPQKTEQKLIYFGRLLHDHLTLKDVLKRYDESQTTHTVHLVCSRNSPDPAPADDTAPSASSTESSPMQTLPGHDGVRHRHTATHSSEQEQHVYPANDGSQQLNVGFNNDMMGAMAGLYPGMMPAMMPAMMPGMMAYTPEQMQWFQQMYAQQMAQYMNMYNGAYQAPPANQASGEAETRDEPADPEVQENQGNRAARDGPIRMNAQGGPVMDDDEEDNANRDWLDWTYTLCRFGVLISLVYFYSTLGRFFLVFAFYFLVYIYQAGYLRMLLPRPQRREPRQAPPQQEQPEPDQQDGDNAEEDQPAQEENVEPINEVREPPPPNSLALAWSFFANFFLSLFPQPPEAVNAN